MPRPSSSQSKAHSLSRSSKKKPSLISESESQQSKLIELVEQYLAKADWTKQQFMAEIGLGEAQYYRWARGENVPSRSVVNRMAAILARRLDERYQNLPHDPFPYSDIIDGLLNEFLAAAGYSASIQGRGPDSSWQEINKNRAWRLGYTSVDPYWSEKPVSYGGKPSGLAIACAERVGDLLGVSTEWHYLTWQQMPLAIAERRVHGIAPFVLSAPGRLFDYRFSVSLDEALDIHDKAEERKKLIFELNAVSFLKYEDEEDIYIEDLPREQLELVYIANEIGSFIVNSIDQGDVYNKKMFLDKQSAIAYIQAEEDRRSGIIPMLCSDSMTCKSIAKSYNWSIVKIKRLKDVKLSPAFAFHPEEERLAAAVNTIIKTINVMFSSLT